MIILYYLFVYIFNENKINMDFKGLENKLAVHIGDILLLETESKDKVIGYVKELTLKTVILSHESPSNKKPYGKKYIPNLTIGDREYDLYDFNEYKIISLNSPSEDSEE